METIIEDQILDYLLTNKLISKQQHGFIRRHSTTTNLLESTHDWIVGLGGANNIDVVYIGLLIFLKRLTVLCFQSYYLN